MANGDVAVVLINWREVTYGEFEIDLTNLGLNGINFQIVVRDLWAHKDLQIVKGNKFKVNSIPPHGNHALRFRVLGKYET